MRSDEEIEAEAAAEQLKSSFNERPHRRFNPLTRSWVLCSPHRAKRPWLGAVEKTETTKLPAYDPACYLCPGNTRATNGTVNDKFEGTYVFDNDFPSVRGGDGDFVQLNEDDLFIAQSNRGACKVICFSPKHNATLPDMTVGEITEVVRVWRREYEALGRLDYINYVQIFENKGSMMGCSNPHPHCQIWATEAVPDELAKELDAFAHWRASKNGACLLCAYVERERARAAERVVCANASFTALVPFWAVWPFEMMIVGHQRHLSSLAQLTPDEERDLADIIKQVTTKYDNLFQCHFPYSMGIHQAPTTTTTSHSSQRPQQQQQRQDDEDDGNENDDGDGDEELFHLHMHFYPPLLRSATVRKFLVGYELCGEPQRDMTPEQAAARLRDLPAVLYRDLPSNVEQQQ